MTVTGCVCHQVSLNQLKAIMDRTGAGLVELHQQTHCGSRCGLCIPYIRYMIQSGDTSPPVMWSAEFAARGIKCTAIERLESRLIEQGKLSPREITPEKAQAEVPHIRSALS